MKRTLCSLILAAVLALTACAPAGDGHEEERLTIVATTYPVYLFATAVTEGVEGVAVERLNTGDTSCLHDYTLSVNDMKLLERADIIAMNGAGLEEFLEDALATSGAAVIDCSAMSEGALLENASHHHDEEDHSHHGHDHGHFDPHFWMDPVHADRMVACIRQGLCEADPENAALYDKNAERAALRLEQLNGDMTRVVEGLTGNCPGLITFHDGFRYFCHAFDLELLESIEEEAGSEASASEIVEISRLVKEQKIPAIFTEVNGSAATANAIARETGCKVYALDMIMNGEGSGIQPYVDAMLRNIQTVAEAMR